VSDQTKTEREPIAGHSGELRDYSRGEIGEVDHRDVSHATGLVQDDDVLELMSFAESAYQRRKSPDDPPFHETNWFQRRAKKYGTKTATRAIRDGNPSQMSYFAGNVGYQNDISGLHTARKLEHWLIHSENCKLIYVAGLMGRGKTDWCCSMFEVIHWYYERLRQEIAKYGGSPDDIPEPEFAANFEVSPPANPRTSDVNCAHCASYDDLLDWIGEDGSSDDVRWFLFDEASTELTAQSAKTAQDVAEIFAPFVKKMRKDGVNMIVVGHDKGDVHIAIRSMANFVSKPGQKKAEVYRSIKNRNEEGHMYDLDRIPQTTWEYDTDDMATWNWGSAKEDIKDDDDLKLDKANLKRVLAKTAADLVEDKDMTQKEAVEAVNRENTDISRQMVRKAIDGEYDELTV
jgi:hypothetical protein